MSAPNQTNKRLGNDKKIKKGGVKKKISL